MCGVLYFFVAFPCVVPGREWCLAVSIPDLAFFFTLNNKHFVYCIIADLDEPEQRSLIDASAFLTDAAPVLI